MLSCEDEFDVNAEWKDITIVYGLLDVNDTIHYIKINKAFLNEETSAIELAQNIDSIHYPDILSVVLEEYVKGNPYPVNIIHLEREYIENKEPGIFNYPGQYLYRTPGDNTQLNPVATYLLKITNEETGKIISSRAGMIQGLEPLRPIPNGHISFYPSSYYEISWSTGKNAYFYNLEVKAYYTEREKGSSIWLDTIELKWPIFSYRRSPDLGGLDLMTTKIQGAAFYQFMASQVLQKSGENRINPSWERKFLNFEFIYSSGGEEIYYYINVNKPSIGLIQKKPEYSNIDNGYGVFSSRNHFKFEVRLANVDSLIEYSITKDLNFIK